MSKYIKYISSDHFGAPEIKGDRWGYCVEMLRKCLVEGFNERTDLNKIEVLSDFIFEATFISDHKYVANQTIVISGISYPEMNMEVFITEASAKTIKCKSYVNVSSMIGVDISGQSGKSKVAPLGMIEKFKDGNKSVFTTDEEKAYFYIDDSDGVLPQGYFKCPNVFMASKMTDINTASGNIFPFDSNNPTRYKEKNWKLSNGNDVTGLLSFITFGVYSTSYPQNNSDQQKIPIKYAIIGNGRLFYFIPTVYVTPSQGRVWDRASFIYAFGKTETDVKNAINSHVLIGSPARNDWGSFASNRMWSNYSIPALTNKRAIYDGIKTDTGNGTYAAMLSVNGRPQSLYFYQGLSLSQDTIPDNQNVLVSGDQVGNYPNPYTKKYYVSRVNLFDNSMNKVGRMSGLLWTQNTSSMFLYNGNISRFKYKGKDKFLYNYVEALNAQIEVNLNSNNWRLFTYQISLDYDDWRNYE